MSISVIIPSYNAAGFIAETIESVLAQTRRADQVLIIDDGSKDDTVAVASRYAPAVEVISQVNAGPAAARNHGLDRATGDLIAFLDADDLWLPEKLARQEAFLLASPDLVGVGGGFIEFGHGPEAAFAVPDDAASRRLTALDYLVGFLFYPSTLMIRRSLGGAVRFPKGLEGEDLIYEAMLRTKGPIGSLPEPMVRKRAHAGQFTRWPNHFAKMVQSRLQWAEANHHDLGVDAKTARTAILRDAEQLVEGVYWRRDRERFVSLRDQLVSVWPPSEPMPTVLKRKLPPAWLLMLKDTFDRVRGGAVART
jgi:glycosyltransferase involved in cell wall biosynthesis